ncbi:MAG: glycine--tRNA ligase subunit beta [Cellvibrio sp.]
MSADFLVELGTEELPPKALKNLMNSFASSIEQQLRDLELSFTAVKPFAAPRRLAVLVEGLASQTPSKDLVVWGPPAAIAFKDGEPTKAALAFAEKNGIAPSELKAESDGKAEKLVARITTQGQAVQGLLGEIVNNALAQLPIAKRMRWGAKRAEFVRPAHWLVMLYGSDVVDASALNIQSGRESRGHRFHANHAVSIASAADYANTLRKEGHVEADFAARQAIIREQVEAAAKEVGGVAMIDADLLDEVTSLVEWPQALRGQFEERFLAVPAEALIASMKEHQKYFHVVNAEGKLLNYFITVANIVSKDPAAIIDGNERVIRPRLSDAAFFFETDKKTTLESLRERLKNIVFQAQLGTVYEKTERVAKLAAHIASLTQGNAAWAERAGLLCKSDLVTNMVGEFDDMQGIAGFYYAQNDGEAEEVALAMNEQYLPRFAGDVLPTSATGTLVALADRLDTLTGIFGIGQLPTGSKDPFALRRASIAVLRLLIEKNLPLDLRELLSSAAAQHANLTTQGDALVEQVLGYMLDRFRNFYEDENIPAEVFQAVAAKNLSQPLDIHQRVLAVNNFAKLPEAAALAAANKRVSNILSKNETAANLSINSSLLSDEAEKVLAAAISAKQEVVAPLFAAHSYTEALTALADLQAPVDAFFDNVMVMCEDVATQQNRLALLQALRALFLEVADISLLVPAK